MGLFGKKQDELVYVPPLNYESYAEEKARELTEKNEQLTLTINYAKKMRSITGDDAQRQFVLWVAELKSILPTVSSQNPDVSLVMAEAVDSIYYVQRQWRKLNYDILSDKQLAVLYCFYSEVIPYAIDLFDYYMFTDPHGGKYQGCEPLYKKGYFLGENFKKLFVFEDYAEYAPDQSLSGSFEGFIGVIRFIAKYIRRQVIDSQKADKPQGRTARLSYFAEAGDEELFKRVQAIEELWSMCKHEGLSLEDLYYLEQVMVRYIPESWVLYRSFKDDEVSVQGHAKGVLMEQLRLVETKLQAINSRRLESLMQNMSHQSAFLEELNAGEKSMTAYSVAGQPVNLLS